MTYSKGSVVFVMHTKNPMSKILAWFMRQPNSDWTPSHSALIVDVWESDCLLSETTDIEVGYGRLSAYLNEPKDEVEIYEPIGVNEADIELAIRECENNKGKLYAFWQLISWAVVILLGKIGLRIPNFLAFGFVCNSHVLDGIRVYDIPPFLGIKPQTIHTAQMRDMMRSSKYWRLVLRKEATK